MRTVRAWLARIVGFVLPGRGEREFDRELRSHLEHHIDDNIRAGMTPEEARRAASIKLGSVAAVAEAHRDQRGLPAVESILQDVRYALRGIRRTPAFAAACIITLTLGIGANTAIFSVVHGVLFAPLPYDNPEQLVAVWTRNPSLQREGSPLSAPDVTELARAVKTAKVEAFQASAVPISLVMGTDAVPAQGALVTPGMMRLLGRQPLLGRWLEHNDVAGAIVLSHAFWQRLGSDPGVIGRAVSDGRRPLTIVGVMPPEFVFPYPSMLRAPVTFTASSEIDFWASLPETVSTDRAFADRNTRLIGVVARMKDDVDLHTARADFDVAWRQLAQAFPATNSGWETQVVPLHEQAVGGVRQQLLLLLGSVGIVLVVACVNVANLLLARGMARQRELALRSALGAGRGRLLQQLLVESLTYAGIGATAGILLAKWGTPLLVSWAPAGTPRLDEIGLSWPVAAFTVGVALLCGVVVGALPGFGAARADVRHAIEQGARGSTGGRHRLRGALVAAQLAFAVVLSVGAALLTRSFVAVVNTDPGFRTDRILTLQVTVPAKYTKASDTHIGFYRNLFTRLEAVPGVVSVGGTTRLPLGGTNSSTQVAVEGRVPPEGQWPEADFRRAVHDYFKTMEIPLRRGRAFTDADRADAPPVAVINESFAAKFFANEDPIGRQIRLGPSSPLRQATIVGIVGDLRHQRLDAAPSPEIYVNYLQAPPYAPLIVIRTAGDPAPLGPSVRAALRDVDASILPFPIKTMSELRSASVAPRIFLMALIASFSVLALVLAGVGVYGVLTLIVAERRREIGIRLALGASPSGMVALIVNHALFLSIAGISAGVVMAVMLSPMLASQLYGVGASDPATIASTAVGLLVMSLLASFVPAARAMRVDPVRTLRAD